VTRLKYFTALQQSLDEDVNAWEIKALEYRKQLKSLQAKGESELNSKLKSKSVNGKKEEKKATNKKQRFIHDEDSVGGVEADRELSKCLLKTALNLSSFLD
jgi:hypothetical protein